MLLKALDTNLHAHACIYLHNACACVRVHFRYSVRLVDAGWLVSEYLGLADLKIGTFRLRWKLTAKGELCEKKLSAEGTRAMTIAMATNLSGRYH